MDTFEYKAYSDLKLSVLDCVKEYISRRNDPSKTISGGFNKHFPEIDQGNICRN